VAEAMSERRDPTVVVSILTALDIWLQREQAEPRAWPTVKQLSALSEEKFTPCQQVLQALKERWPPGDVPHSITHLIERLIECEGDLARALSQESRLSDKPSDEKGDWVRENKSSSWGDQSRVKERRKKFSRSQRGAFQPIQTEAEQERLERAVSWLKALVRRVPVELQRGFHFPARLEPTLGALRVEFPFPEEPECPIYLIVPHGTNRQTDRQALESTIKRFRDLPGGLRLVCLWDFWRNVRPPAETHGIVSMIEEWTDWAHVERITRQAERSLHLVGDRTPPDKQHHRSLWAGALLLHKYGYPPEVLLLIAARSGRQITFDRRAKRRQYENNGNLSYLWSPERVSFLLNAYQQEDPEAHARELAYLKAQETAARQQAEQRAQASEERR
jgi:hypothetical protein